jgi:hypothetical protein
VGVRQPGIVAAIDSLIAYRPSGVFQPAFEVVGIAPS